MWSWGRRSTNFRMWLTRWRASCLRQKMHYWPRSSIHTGCQLWVCELSGMWDVKHYKVCRVVGKREMHKSTMLNCVNLQSNFKHIVKTLLWHVFEHKLLYLCLFILLYFFSAWFGRWEERKAESEEVLRFHRELAKDKQVNPWSPAAASLQVKTHEITGIELWHV